MADDFRPPWFGNRGLQVVSGGALVWALVQLVQQLGDGAGGDAFLSGCWAVLFGYVLRESLSYRKRQDAARADEPADDSTDDAPPAD